MLYSYREERWRMVKKSKQISKKILSTNQKKKKTTHTTTTKTSESRTNFKCACHLLLGTIICKVLVGLDIFLTKMVLVAENTMANQAMMRL